MGQRRKKMKEMNAEMLKSIVSRGLDSSWTNCLKDNSSDLNINLECSRLGGQIEVEINAVIYFFCVG